METIWKEFLVGYGNSQVLGGLERERCPQVSKLSDPAAPRGTHGSCPHKHTWCLSPSSYPLFSPTSNKTKKACSFRELSEDHLLKELGCQGLPDACLAPVCSDCSPYRERLRRGGRDSWEHQSTPGTSRECVLHKPACPGPGVSCAIAPESLSSQGLQH